MIIIVGLFGQLVWLLISLSGCWLACLATHVLHPFRLVVLSDGAWKACWALALHPFSASAKFDGVKKLVWYKFYILFRFQQYPMVWKKLVWHKLYIRLRLQPYPMVRPPRNAHIYYIHLRIRSNPMVYLLEMLKLNTSNQVLSRIRWSTCSETLKFNTSICALY